jgi:integrase
MSKLPPYLEKPWNVYHATLKVPKDVQSFIGRKKFYKSLETDSVGEANIRKLPVIAEWKTQIKVARAAQKDGQNLSVDEQVAYYKGELERNFKGYEADGLMLVHDILDEKYLRNHNQQDMTVIPARTDTTDAEKKAAYTILNRVSGDWTATHERVDEFIAQAQYTLQTADECRTNLRLFCDRFAVFEVISEEQVEAWILELLQELQLRTVKKKIGFVRTYWNYCKKRRYTTANPGAVLTDSMYPKIQKTKATVTEVVKAKRKAFTVDDYHKLLNAKPDDHALCDLIRLAAYTGCRREEICSMPLRNVLSDRFIVEDAKTESGWREIPIHSEIKQFVARLVSESTDGFLLSGLDGKNNKYGKRGNAVGRRFLRLRDRFYNHQYVLHSFRKTLASQMQTAGVHEAHAAQIIGHEIDTITYGLYGTDIGFAAKVVAMEKCSYLGVR